jgi:hypothetical protein
LSGSQAVGDPRSCLVPKPSDCLQGRWTVGVRMQMNLMSSRIGENGWLSRESKIDWYLSSLVLGRSTRIEENCYRHR